MILNRNKLFNALYVAYLTNMVLEESNFSAIPKMATLLSATRFLILLFLIAIAVTMNYKGYRSLFMAVGLWAVCSALNMLLKHGGIRLLIVILLVYCSKCSTLNKILENAVKTLAITSLFIILCAKIGIIEDSINIRYSHDFLRIFFDDGRYERHSFGFLFSNQVPFMLMFIYFLEIVRYKESLGKWVHSIVQVLNIIVFIYCGSRTVFLLICMTGILCFWVYAKNNILRQRGRKINLHIGIMIFPLCCIFSIFLPLFYNQSLYFLDVMSNFRISNAQKGLRAYGLNLLSGGVSAGTHNGTVDVIIDNGYMMLMIREGILIGMLVIIIWTYIGCLAEKRNNDYLKIVLVILAISNLIDYHLLSYRIIPFLCILLKGNDQLLVGNQFLKKIKRKKRKVLIC